MYLRVVWSERQGRAHIGVSCDSGFPDKLFVSSQQKSVSGIEWRKINRLLCCLFGAALSAAGPVRSDLAKHRQSGLVTGRSGEDY